MFPWYRNQPFNLQFKSVDWSVVVYALNVLKNIKLICLIFCCLEYEQLSAQSPCINETFAQYYATLKYSPTIT